MAEPKRLRDGALAALNELCTAFSAANRKTNGTLLRDALAEPGLVHRGLVTVIARLVFMRYADTHNVGRRSHGERSSWSIEKLRDELSSHREATGRTRTKRPDAWNELLRRFRAIHAACSGRNVRTASGGLFDPSAFPFLEGRTPPSRSPSKTAIDIDDAVVASVLDHLFSAVTRDEFAELEVEQLGACYEAMMALDVVEVRTRSVLTRSSKLVPIEPILAAPAERRAKLVAELTGEKPTKRVRARLERAATSGEVVELFAKGAASPPLLEPGMIALTPSDERRRSGSHYTPRALTEPVVERTLLPLIEDLGRRPRPEAILDLKVCDPAMGSGAFLLAACRTLARALVTAWRIHRCRPASREPADTLAKRLVALHCLYGVDKNPLAVELAKLSLWLETHSASYSFDFLDHALRAGDSLVGLTRDRLAAFHWERRAPIAWLSAWIDERVAEARRLRQDAIRLAAPDEAKEKARLLRSADDAIESVRALGDLVVDAFFSAANDRAREAQRTASLAQLATADRSRLRRRSTPGQRLTFHWEIEFPEVFEGAGNA